MKKVILALAICATIASCQKKEDTDPIDVSKTTYLMGKDIKNANGSRWKLTYSAWLPDINDSAESYVDVYTQLSGCVKDNYMIFNTKDRVTIYEGNSKCNVSDPDSTTYGYKLTDVDKHIEIYTDPDAVEHNILLAGDITYPKIDSFVITYTAPRPDDSTKTSRYVRGYVKQ